MATYLLIAGHGYQRDGTFDSGATGFVRKGEYRYMVEDLFPAMKKYQPETDKFIYFTDHKVSNHGTLKTLADRYGADEVIEFHFDAFNATARGGHVIIHQDYRPDAMDLRIRDVIGSMMKDTNFDGLRFSHHGHRGISGRNNLYNVNMARREGITFRLLELGFGTNRREANIMINQVDEYAKKLVEAILNKKVEGQPVQKDEKIEDKTPSDLDLNFNQVVSKAMSGGYANQPHRERNINEQTRFRYADVQKEIDLRLGGGRSTSEPEPSFEIGSRVVISNSASTYANTNGVRIPNRIKGNEYTVQQVRGGNLLLREINSWVRKSDIVTSSSGKVSESPVFERGARVTISNSASTYSRTNNVRIPNRIKGNTYTIQDVGNNDVLLREIFSWVRKSDLVGHGSSGSGKSIDQMAREVIRGEHGNGHENRRRSLGISQSEYDKVRRRVNQLA